MRIIKQHRVYRQDLRNNPGVAYLFGDNMRRTGMGGQAAEMRGEPNAFGIPTKWTPTMFDNAFFCDSDQFKIIEVWEEDFLKVKRFAYQNDWIIVVPSDGLGTGLSQLDKRAPKLFKYLEKVIEEEFFEW